MKFSFLILLLLASQAQARTWNIEVDGSGDAPTVQAGIDSSASGDSVVVSPGTYTENLSFNGKNIVLISEAGPDNTVLDGSSQVESVVLFINGESRSAILEGFTITGGSGYVLEVAAKRGGGIYIRLSSPIIRGNHIIGNATDNSFGGGIFVTRGSAPSTSTQPLIENNIIENNDAINGGGITCLGSDPIIRNNIFRGNRSLNDGGGILVRMREGSAIIENNEFWDNLAADHGAGIYAVNRENAVGIFITNNLFVRNRAGGLGTGDSGSGGAIWINSFSGEISNNTIVDNFGTGESVCSGGGILFDTTPANLSVRYNVIANNDGCGIACRGDVQTQLESNLLWENLEGDLGTGVSVCPLSWNGAVLITDPFFCGPENDDYTVAENSPALSPQVMGAFSEPGCGPVSVHPTTWGQIKARYGN